MGGRRSRTKGARTERRIVNALQAYGLAAVRVPLSGACGGRFAGDIILPLMGRDLCVEVRKNMVPATSCGMPSRFNGMRGNRTAVSGDSIAVSISPGATALTRTPILAKSAAISRVRADNAAFEVA